MLFWFIFDIFKEIDKQVQLDQKWNSMKEI